MKTVAGLFDEIDTASDVVQELVDNGYSRDDISLVARNFEGKYADRSDIEADRGEMAAEGAVAGVFGGGMIGAAAGLLVGVTALAIPGIGPIVVAGPLASTLAGAGIGAATGGILGALVGWGIPDEEAEYYAEGVRRGGTLVVVKAGESQVENIIAIMDDYDPVNIKRRSEYWRESGWNKFDPQGKPYSRTDYEDESRQYQDNRDMGYSTNRANGFADYSEGFRHHYNENYAGSGYFFDYYEPGYLYGYNLATSDNYRNYSDWNALENQARAEWERTENRAGGTWEDVKDAVRHAWESVADPFNEEDYDRTY